MVGFQKNDDFSNRRRNKTLLVNANIMREQETLTYLFPIP